MITDKIIALIESSDMMPTRKLIAKSKIEQITELEQKRKEDRDLIEKIADEKKISEIVFSNTDVKIYTVFSNREWDIKNPYRIIYKNEGGAWRKCNTILPSLDLAYLTYLEHKHIGLNSQFAKFAAKMLEIKTN